jgi:hypothetical protein
MNKFFVLLIVVIITFTTYAFASSQTGAGAGGEGVNAVSGYVVSGVHYQLTDSAALSAVEFDLNAPAQLVKASLNSSNGFFNCHNSAGYHWVCNINEPMSVSEMNELKVVAAGG